MKIIKYQKPISDDFIHTKPDQRFHFVGKCTSKVTISLTERKRDIERELDKNKMEFKKKLVYHFKANPEQNRRVFPQADQRIIIYLVSLLFAITFK